MNRLLEIVELLNSVEKWFFWVVLVIGFGALLLLVAWGLGG